MKNKILKVLLIISIVIIALIVLPKIEEAKDYSSIKTGSGTVNLADSLTKVTFNGYGATQNENVYCVESDQQIWHDGCTYNVTIITFDGNKLKVGEEEKTLTANEIKTANQLAYLLSQDPYVYTYEWVGAFPKQTTHRYQINLSDGGGNMRPFGTDAKQLALWKILKDNSNLAKIIFNVDSSTYGVGTKTYNGKQVIYKVPNASKNFEKVLFENPDKPWNAPAYTMWQNALNFTGIGSFKIYLLKNADQQNLMIIETATVDDKPTVELSFKKEDLSSNAVSGAKINISGISNVSSISNTSFTSTNSTGINLGTTKVTPTTNNGTFKIRVTETTVPSTHIGIGFVDLEVTYNTSTGKVTSITETNSNVEISSDKTVIIKNRPAVQIKFNKQNFSGGNLSGATIGIEEGDNVYSINKDSMTIGNDTLIVKPIDLTKNTFQIKLIEKIAPNDYNKINSGNEVILTVTYDENSNVTDISANSSSSNFEFIKNGSYIETVRLKDDSRIVTDPDYTIVKTDTMGNKIQGAEFSLQFTNIDYVKINGITYTADTNGTKTVTGLKTNSDGKIVINKIVAADGETNVTMTATETSPASGYSGAKDSLTLEWNYNTTNHTWELKEQTDPENWETNESTGTITVINKSQIEKLTLIKKDALNGNKLAGATFTITLTNIESIGSYSVGGTQSGKIIITGIKTNADGILAIEDLVIADVTQDVQITIEETSAPVGYKRIEGKIVVTLRRDGNTYSSFKREIVGLVSDTEYIPGANTEFTNHEITLDIKNIPIMNLGGIVWEDTQTGDKQVTGPDGIFNNSEQGMPGIEVKLYKADGTQVTKDAYDKPLMTKTANGGETINYKLYNNTSSTITLAKGEYIFPNIERGNYYVRFTYDGINYQTVKLSSEPYVNNNESKASEENRDAFNSKFTTITKNNANGSAGNISLTYADGNKVTQAEQTINTSTLITRDNNGNLLDHFKMNAKTNNYLKAGDNWVTVCWNNDGTIKTNSYALDINCGLTYRVFDLALGMDIDSAKLTINGKETTYDYNQIIDSNLTDPNNDTLLDEQLENVSKDDEAPNYNLYLYYSDYNYRIDDYVTDVISDRAIIDNDETTENEALIDAADIDAYENDVNKELRVFVTYKVILKNQSRVENAQVNELVYYYDENYEFESATKADGTPILFEDDASFEPIDGKKSARVSGFASALGEDSEYRQELYFTFEVKKEDEDGDGDEELPDIIKTESLECANLAEIISYSTTKGLIDNDSAPDNMISSDGSIRYEDDTDEAKGIKIQIKKDNPRIISGTVFDDADKDGILDAGEEPVNDVIVQLIEIKNINDANFEYIWQETKSGSNEVKTTAKNGYPGKSYNNNTVTSKGGYEFTEFIPGNYIIRFIYGDGTTYDLTENVKKYNGQDYKSTKDLSYTEIWHLNENYTDGTNYKSVARDNEARRLEVMAYSTIVNGELGEKLANKTDDMLKATWMCAETSKINVPVDDQTYTQNPDKKSSNSTETEYENWGGTLDNVEFNQMHFGLALRPETRLVLEKHITGLKISPTGVGVQPIVDAKANIVDIINGDDVTTTGIVTGLGTIKSTRDNRGFWKVETDIEELAQGAELEVEYTYVIRNDGDEDYLSTYLVNSYKEGISNGTQYADFLEGKADELKINIKGRTDKYGTFLGDFYYTGNVPATTDEKQAKVASRVEIIEEALTNQLKYQEAIAGDSFKEKFSNEEKDIFDKDGNPDKEIIETVVQTASPTSFLVAKEGTYNDKTADYSKTLKLTTVLSSLAGDEGYYPSYIAEVMEYSNAAGRRNVVGVPGNLSYVHSYDTEKTLENTNNEEDEFWAEQLIISKPTGEDKITPIQIALITIASIATIGVGIVLIKKFVLNK